jgi:hypothetical protein
VIDTGIDYLHPDLAENMWTNPGEIAGNGIDDDGNGFVDDVYGWDFANDDNDPTDGHYHGTHCAGTVAGVGDNGIGVAGVMWHAQLVALKFLSDGGSGTTTDAIDAVNYANAMGIHITSNSWGGGGYSQGLYDVIAEGGLFIAAAGNSGVDNDLSPHYPSSYACDNIIAVAATDHSDLLASFSCYGLTSVDLGAPGVDVYSCSPGNSYQYLSGTSMATPHVSGAAGLVWSYNPMLTALEIKDLLLQSVDPVSSLNGRVVTGGRLNVAAALDGAGPSWISALPTEQTPLEPGNSQDIIVTVDPAGLVAGQYLAEIGVATNDPRNPEMVISVTADIAGCRSLTTDVVALDFGTVWPGESSQMSLTLTNACNGPVTVQNIASNDGIFSHDAALPLTVEPFSERIVTVSCQPSAAGSHSALLSIRSDAEDNPDIEVQLDARVVDPPQIAVSPLSIERTLPEGGSTVATVSIENSGGDTLDYSIDGAGGGGTLVINEIWNYDDYMEFWNQGDDLDLTGWSVSWNDNEGTSNTYHFPAGFVLGAGRRLVLYENSGTPNDSCLYLGYNLLWIENTILSVSLFDSAGQGVDFVRTRGSTDLPPAGTSWNGDGVDFSLWDIYRNRNQDSDDVADWSSSSTGSAHLINPGQDSSGIQPQWLTLSPSKGSVFPGGTEYIRLDLSAANLAAGTYSAHMRIGHNDPAQSSPLSVDVLLQVYEDRGYVLRAVHTGVSALPRSQGSIYTLQDISAGTASAGKMQGSYYTLELK